MKIPSTANLLLSLLIACTLPCSGATPKEIEDLYDPDLAPFYHGVASGDPLPDGVILWTRVTRRDLRNDADVRVEWKVATDRLLQNVVATGNAFATKQRDFTVKVDVRGLEAGRHYYYGFKALGRNSIIGRTKTAPEGAVDQLKFAVVSCVDMDWGYFSGYQKIAMRRDLDAVIHLGDYIYEYPDNDSYSAREIRDERVIFPAGETIKLNQYRQRYATYHLDPNLRYAHRQHPFIAIWDDHEFANNAWKRGAENHQPQTEGEWSDRKKAAKRAYFEWMPIRENGDRIYRELRYGPLMDLILLDTRVEGRDRQIDDVTNSRLQDPDRTILGGPQKEWLKTSLYESDAIWKVIGNQVIFSEFNIGFAAGADPLISGNMLESQFLDIWDGYPKERNELVRYIGNNGIDNTVILTGDIHCSFAFEVADPAYGNSDYHPRTGEGAVAVEFVTPSLAAANFNEEAGDFVTEELESRIHHGDGEPGGNPNPHMKYADLDRHGYIVLTVQPEQVQADYYFLKDILTPHTTESWGAGLITAQGSHHLTRAEAPAAPKPVQEPPAP